MQSFHHGFDKAANSKGTLGRKLLKGFSTASGIMGGAMAGAGTGLVAKGTAQNSFKDEQTFKDKALNYAPLVGAVLGGALGARHALKGFKPHKKKTSFDAGFAGRVGATKQAALGPGMLMAKQMWESMFSGAGNSLGQRAGATFGNQIQGKREQFIQRKTLDAALQHPGYEGEDLDSLSTMASMSGVQDRAAEVAAGAGLLIGSAGLLRAARPTLRPQANWAAQVANRIQRKVQGPKFKPNLANLALALAAGSFTTGLLSAVAQPVVAEGLGNLTAKAREKDIVKGVERYYSQKQTSGALKGFDQAKTAASVIGVMPGVTSGLRTMKSYGKVRTAKPVSGQSIGPRSKASQTPSPVKSPNAGTPGAAGESVRSTSVPKPTSYGGRLMGRWM